MRMPWEISDIKERRFAPDVAKWPRSVAQLVYTFGIKCYYCGQIVEASDFRHHRYPTRDHKIPKARGGALGRGNRVLACRGCNETKDDMTEDEFRYFIKTGTLAPSYLEWILIDTRRRAKRLGVKYALPSYP